MKRIMRCQVCKKYTLKKIHCNQNTISPHPIASGVEKNIQERLKARLIKLDRKRFEEKNEKDIIPY